MHLEEDAGKSLHEGFPDSDRKTYVDYNRSGVPLIEIVTEPDLRSAADAAEFFSRLRALLVWLDVNDGNMEEGSLRCDANVSVRPSGTSALGTKAEVKNLNSFRFLQKALEYEIERQIDVIEQGGRVVQETRLWDAAEGATSRCAARRKRTTIAIFPSPICRRSSSSRARGGDPRRDAGAARRAPTAVRRVVRAARVRRGAADPVARAGRLLRSDGSRRRASEAVSNWIMGELARASGTERARISTSRRLARSTGRSDRARRRGTISASMAKDVFEKMFASGRTADEIVEAEGLTQIDDEPPIVALVARC